MKHGAAAAAVAAAVLNVRLSAQTGVVATLLQA
jgi:hypothetical protein